MLIQIEVSFSCEAYPNKGESELEVLKRGDFQYSGMFLKRWRSYELDGNGNEINFGQWHVIDDEVRLMRFYD